MPSPVLPNAPAVATSGNDPRAEVGVLLVHGIGEHGEGDTLLSFGEPLIDWLREWLDGPSDGVDRKGAVPRGRVEVLSARMRAERDKSESPAYARVDITAFGPPGDGPAGAGRAEETERWLFAEAWWGDSVKVPAALQLLVWMLLRAPLLVYWHFHGGARLDRELDSNSFWAVLAAGLRGISACVMALALQAVVLVSIVLWAIPIGPWRRALLAAVRTLTAILGDSFVLLEQDIQRATLVQRVRSSLDWLQARTLRVVVIAHSQGAAIAHAALKASPFPRLRGYISVGSGLEKLEMLRLVRQDGSGVWAAQLVGLSALCLVLIVLQPWVGWTSEKGLAWLGAAILVLGVAVAAVGSMVGAMKQYQQALASRLSGFGLRTSTGARIGWADIHAGMDLVPMGSNSQLAEYDFVDQIKVTNEASVVSDHVRYFDTRGDFAPRCWALLSSVSSVLSFAGEDQARLERLRRWHRVRSIGLVIGQCLNPATAVVAALLAGGAVLAIGESLMALLDQAELSWLHRLLSWTGGLLAGGFLWLSPPNATRQDSAHTIVGALAILGAVVGWWMLVTGLWRASSQRLARQVARGKLFGKPGWSSIVPGAAGVALWTLAAMLPLLSVLLAHYTLQEVTVGGIFRAATLLVSGLFWSVGVLFGAAVPLLAMRQIDPGEAPDPNQHLGMLALTLFGGPFYGAIGYWLWHAGQGTAIGPLWLPVLFIAWGGVFAVSTLRNRQVAFGAAGRWGAAVAYVAGLAVGWVWLRADSPATWPLLALAATAAWTLATGFLATRRQAAATAT